MEETVIVQDDLTKKTAYEVSVRTHKAYRLIFFILGVIETFLCIRFFFKLFGANGASWFVAFVYGVSNVLLFPFSGIFQRAAATGPGIQKVFEPSTLVAGVIYVLLAWGLSRLLLIIRSRPLP
jgi:hypothetical protein